MRNRKIRVLLVDDDDHFRVPLHKELEHLGFEMYSLPEGAEALNLVRQHRVDVVLLDIRLAKENGIETLVELKRSAPNTEVIMLTGYGTVDSAVQAMKLGASDFLKKPCSLAEIEATIRQTLERRRLQRENTALRADLEHCQEHTEFVGRSAGLRQVLDLIDRVAQTDSTVLIQGESGVGKELVARAIHRNSHRSKGPFVVVDCGSLHENILQSELFGHEKGAYTGAVNLKHGLFEVADSGTLFMDEVSALHPSIQVNLLRVLESGSFRRVGGTEDIHVNVRVLASTNRNLDELIARGQFREDLYFRLNVVTIPVPPLRARKDDIPLLVDHFLTHSRLARAMRRTISPSALQRLLEYDWPGNIRELQNVIERAMILAKGVTIQPDDLPLAQISHNKPAIPNPPEKWLTLREMELNYIEAVLRSTQGNKLQAAKILGIDRKTLRAKLKRCNSSQTEV